CVLTSTHSFPTRRSSDLRKFVETCRDGANQHVLGLSKPCESEEPPCAGSSTARSSALTESCRRRAARRKTRSAASSLAAGPFPRSEEHTSELQSPEHLLS